MKKRFLKECRVIGCNTKNSDKPFGGFMFFQNIFFFTVKPFEAEI
jgi:hypothetical protein